ncbi:MAG: LppX_LprAFG lipoprotein [Acidimicrobiia bacterium]|nr:LppX_LprAFG lipoprotein [Acidimicrobiia bacterium]
MRRIAAIVIATAVSAGACGGDETGPTLAPNVDVVLAAATDAMTAVDTVYFTLERGGAPVYIDSLDTIAFESAEGRYAAPGRAEAVVQVSLVGLNTQIGAVAIDGVTWITNPITGDYEPAPAGYEFDPATLFDPAVGLPLLLDGELGGATLIGLEDRDGEMRYHVRGTAPAERVEVITARLVRGQDVELDLWLDPVGGEVAEAAFSTEFNAGVTTWRLTFFDYGAEVEITEPNLNG